MDDEAQGDALFLGGDLLNASGRGRVGAALRLAGKGRKDEEVAEAVSPGGHVVKRRARARPLSDELLSTTVPRFSIPKTAASNVVTFPTASSQFRERASPSSSSSSEAGSPVPRRRVSGLHQPKRAPFARVDSATLFFGGPAVASAPLVSPSLSRRVTASVSSDAADSPFAPSSRPKMMNRHSYSGDGSLTPSWRHTQSAMSPQTSPPLSHAAEDTESYDTDDDDPMMVDLPTNSSFVLNITEDTPSPKRICRRSDQISQKYTRDSGIALSEDEDMGYVESSTSSEQLSAMPQASSSVSSLYSDFEEGLVTPGVAPRSNSGWPDAVIVSGSDDSGCGSVDVDAFILRTLAAAAKGTQEVKKAPGTPVKKSKVSYLAGQRPWQSAMAHKVGFGAHAEEKTTKKVPRKSMPAAFPLLGRKSSKSLLDPGTDSESDYDDSPSNRKEKYVGLGIGLPSLSKEGAPRNRWLMRRTSSGAFSSGSDSMSIGSTPTRNRLGDHLRPSGSPHLPTQSQSTSQTRLKLSPARSASSSSNSSSVTSPSILRKLPIPEGQKYGAPRFSGRARRLSQPTHQQRPGRFEQQFVEIAEVGSGEFGKVLKVRTKHDISEECFAIKKSKRFEGVKHRLRLREEVETLQHLTEIGGGLRHPNVLAFIDAWEEDEQLFIWTELCEGGNFANFLWEYGRVFPRLDQARVWKIIVELSNGLKFIHDSGVIHLDLKPANIFLTSEGRFKIGDFGMASLWPRPRPSGDGGGGGGSFEREGDKLYLAPEVLQGKYGKAADMFSFGMTILETASNIVVPDQGEAWHRLRKEDFSQVDLEDSPEVLRLVQQMMRTNPSLRVGIYGVYNHPVVTRARVRMEQAYNTAKRAGTSLFAASPLASASEEFLPAILDI
ncbi:kinase-like domain-containing protein [Rhodocollybia butyracea]|uniref:Kinase-like domain-containing protein n=1 Tax=Rhodocollybia butyracea TaxID=206335 RepID=A0A9P5PI02_9AGAR|nr:kinase-like domain-containing protein [Rhodocollybia butyracea]